MLRLPHEPGHPALARCEPISCGTLQQQHVVTAISGVGVRRCRYRARSSSVDAHPLALNQSLSPQPDRAGTDGGTE